MQLNELKKGDILKCNGIEEMLEKMETLETNGYRTEFVHEHEGIKGLWLEIIRVPEIITDKDQYERLVKIESYLKQMTELMKVLTNQFEKYRQGIAREIIENK